MGSIKTSTDGATAADSVGGTRCLLFAAGGRLFGCEIAVVREIVPARRATRLPGAPEYVLGLINLRGTVVTVIDLVRRLGGESADARDGSIILVVYGKGSVGLAVDEVRDVQSLVTQRVETTSGNAPEGVPAAIVRGLARTPEGLVTLLDVRAVLRQVMSLVEEES